MFCEKCGAEIPKGAKFCEKCGSVVKPDIQEEGNSHKKWILGGIIGGVTILTVAVVGGLFATGTFGGKEKTLQTSANIGMKSGTGVSEAAVQPIEQLTEQPAATPVITPSPIPEPTEVPLDRDEPEEDASDVSSDEEDGTIVRTPEETYKQYIENFIEAVNTGDTEGLSQVLSGKVYKQQCDLVENYYSRGIQEELQSYTILSAKQIDDSCTKINVKETIKVFYEGGSSKVVKQKYSYVCKCINSMWVITNMKGIK